MPTTPNDLTKRFISQVESLIKEGIAANYAEIVRELNWNKSMMSEVIKSRKNVPVAVYRKFAERYGIKSQETVSEPDIGNNIRNGTSGKTETQTGFKKF